MQLASPDEEAESDGVLLADRTEVSAVEAVWIIREQEDLTGSENSAAVPDRQRTSETICEVSHRHQPAVDRYVDTAAADAISGNRDDRFEQMHGAWKVASVGRQRCGVRWKASQGNVSNSRGGADDTVQPNGDARRRVPRKQRHRPRYGWCDEQGDSSHHAQQDSPRHSFSPEDDRRRVCSDHFLRSAR